jgi:hypothetical protein
MKRILLISVLVWFCYPSRVFGQGSILWEVTGNGLAQKSFVMGTLKFIGEKEFYLPEVCTNRLKQCQLFAIEDQVDHHAQHELNKAMHYPKGQSLATALSASDYQVVQKFFESEFGINAAAFKKRYAVFKPLALSIAMTRLSLKEQVKFYDIELLTFAKDNGLETYSLESIEREAQALQTYPEAEQVKALLHSVQNFETQKEEFQKLVRDYPEGKLEEIFEYTLHPVENNPVFVEEFYYKRNEEWLPKIEKMMAEKPSFIAVGVSHLEGERGLLKLLQAKGYTLTAITVK